MTISMSLHSHMRRISHLLFILSASALLAGCRLYGGYGTVEATQDAIAAETARASEELQSAERTLRSLRAAAEVDSRLTPIVAKYSTLVDIHGRLVTRYQTSLDEVLSSGSYHTVSRRLGAMLTEQRQILDAYEALSESAAMVIAPDRVPELTVPAHMYGVYPAVYYAWWHAERTNAVRRVVRSAG